MVKLLIWMFLGTILVVALALVQSYVTQPESRTILDVTAAAIGLAIGGIATAPTGIGAVAFGFALAGATVGLYYSGKEAVLRCGIF